jgi:hypothetical protein
MIPSFFSNVLSLTLGNIVISDWFWSHLWAYHLMVPAYSYCSNTFLSVSITFVCKWQEPLDKLEVSYFRSQSPRLKKRLSCLQGSCLVVLPQCVTSICSPLSSLPPYDIILLIISSLIIHLFPLFEERTISYR